MVALAQATRSYTNFKEEGRVRAGQKFAIGKKAAAPYDSLVVITEARYRVLTESGLVRAWDPAAQAQIPAAPAPNYPGQAKSKAVQRPVTTAKRAVTKLREAAPAAPTPLANPAGGKTGPAASPSSSAPARASSNVPLPKRRGQRRGGSKPSSSTQAIKSAETPTSSTPATGAGGVAIKDARHSRV